MRLIRELADYQNHRHEAVATEADLLAALFPTDRAPSVFAHVAQVGPRVVGMAVWYPSFSTWTGRNGIWLEDLFVEPEHRGARLGLALLAELARECEQRGAPRLEWHVAQWNESSIGFYRGLGARRLAEQQVFRISGQALEEMAGR